MKITKKALVEIRELGKEGKWDEALGLYRGYFKTDTELYESIGIHFETFKRILSGEAPRKPTIQKLIAFNAKLEAERVANAKPKLKAFSEKQATNPEFYQAQFVDMMNEANIESEGSTVLELFWILLGGLMLVGAGLAFVAGVLLTVAGIIVPSVLAGGLWTLAISVLIGLIAMALIYAMTNE
jgi:hypothetical protein